MENNRHGKTSLEVISVISARMLVVENVRELEPMKRNLRGRRRLDQKKRG